MASNLYLLPCTQCEHPLEVQTRQAGQTVQCSECGHSFEAPRLGELKNLEQVAAVETRSAASAPSSILKRWMFTLGLAMAVLLGASGVGVYQFASSIQREIDPDKSLQEINEKIDQFSAAEL